MNGDRVRLVWTTNFDPLVADGCAKDSEGFNRIGSHWKNGVYQRVMLLRSIS